jgi:hypothetical protein
MEPKLKFIDMKGCITRQILYGPQKINMKEMKIEPCYVTYQYVGSRSGILLLSYYVFFEFPPCTTHTKSSNISCSLAASHFQVTTNIPYVYIIVNTFKSTCMFSENSFI